MKQTSVVTSAAGSSISLSRSSRLILGVLVALTATASFASANVIYSVEDGGLPSDHDHIIGLDVVGQQVYMQTTTQLYLYAPYSPNTGTPVPDSVVPSFGTELKLTDGSVVTPNQPDIISEGVRGILYVFDTSDLTLANTITPKGIVPSQMLVYGNGEVYTSSGSEIYAIDPSSGATTPLFDSAYPGGCGGGTCTGSASGAAIGPGGLLYTLDATDDLVDIYNPTNGILSSFPIMSGSGADGPMTVGPDGNIYLADAAGGAVVYSSTGMLLATLVPTVDQPDTSGEGGNEVLTLDPNGDLWVYTQGDGLHIYDTADISDAAAAPEPATVMLCGLGVLVALSGRRIGRRKPVVGVM